MAHVQTVLGPIDPTDLGFTLPHEHTQIALWHIELRWDYWQLTRDEPIILEELARFRAAGGRSLVDLTLPGVGRDPDWLRGLAEASGLNLVMGCGWYRTAYYPPEARIDRRSADDLADELVTRDRGRGRGQRRPARDHRRDRDGQAVGLASRGAGASGGRAGRAPDRAGDHDPCRAVRRRPRPAPDLRGGRRRSGRVVIGHADSYPNLDHYLAIIERGATIEFDFLGMAFSAVERLGEGRVVELLCELLSRGHADRILLSQDVCHDSQLKRYEGNGYVYLAEIVPAAVFGWPACRTPRSRR